MIHASLELIYWFILAGISVFALIKIPKHRNVVDEKSSPGEPLFVNESAARSMTNMALLRTFETFVTMGRVTNVEPGVTFLRNEINQRLDSSEKTKQR